MRIGSCHPTGRRDNPLKADRSSKEKRVKHKSGLNASNPETAHSAIGIPKELSNSESSRISSSATIHWDDTFPESAQTNPENKTPSESSKQHTIKNGPIRFMI